MSPSLFAFIFLMGVVAIWSLFGYRILSGKRMGSNDVHPVRSEDRGGPLNKIARWVVLGLGRLTFLVIRLFEKLGVDVAKTIDEALSGWTTYASDLKTAKAASDAHAADLQGQLEALQSTYDDFVATDAATDAQQAEDLKAQVAQQIADALSAAQNPPVLPDPPADVPADPATPVDETPVTPDPEPTGGDATPPAPFDPAEPVVDAPVEEPVVPEGTPVTPDSLDPAPVDAPVDAAPADAAPADGE